MNLRTRHLSRCIETLESSLDHLTRAEMGTVEKPSAKNLAMPALDLQPDHLHMLLDVLSRHAPGAEVWAYGSRVTGAAHDGSGLGLVLRRPGRLDQPLKNVACLRAALSESNPPMLVEVLDWARIPEVFRRDIERRHVAVVSSESVSAK